MGNYGKRDLTVGTILKGISKKNTTRVPLIIIILLLF